MRLTKELREFFESQGYYSLREIEGKGICALLDFVFTTGLIIHIDEVGYLGRYCYHTKEEAQQSLDVMELYWPTNPNEDAIGNWVKYKGLPNERSNPNYKKE